MNQANLFHSWLDFLQEEDGATAVEYAVMLALIIAVCASAVNSLSNATEQSFQSSGTAIANAGGS